MTPLIGIVLAVFVALLAPHVRAVVVSMLVLMVLATALFDSQKGGPGKASLYADIDLQYLRNDEADGAAILDHLDAMAQSMAKNDQGQDVAVILVSSHGEMIDGQFYLIPYGFDAGSQGRSIKSAVSASEFAKKVAALAAHGKVLLLLDACHSGSAAKGLLGGFKPATDDASRQLADEECGVTLLAAAMGYEKALEEGKNGLFTQGLLAALRKTKSLPYNYRDGRQYVHHLFGYVFDEVKHLSKDKQHPFLSLPWTAESFALRQISNPEEAAP